MASPVAVALGVTAAIVGGIVLFGGKKKSSGKKQTGPEAWGTMNCGTQAQLRNWTDCIGNPTCPTRFRGATQTRAELPTAAELLAAVGKTDPGVIAVAIESECSVYVWDGDLFVIDQEETNALRQAIQPPVFG